MDISTRVALASMLAFAARAITAQLECTEQTARAFQLGRAHHAQTMAVATIIQGVVDCHQVCVSLAVTAQLECIGQNTALESPQDCVPCARTLVLAFSITDVVIYLEVPPSHAAVVTWGCTGQIALGHQQEFVSSVQTMGMAITLQDALVFLLAFSSRAALAQQEDTEPTARDFQQDRALCVRRVNMPLKAGRANAKFVNSENMQQWKAWTHVLDATPRCVCQGFIGSHVATLLIQTAFNVTSQHPPMHTIWIKNYGKMMIIDLILI